MAGTSAVIASCHLLLQDLEVKERQIILFLESKFHQRILGIIEFLVEAFLCVGSGGWLSGVEVGPAVAVASVGSGVAVA